MIEIEVYAAGIRDTRKVLELGHHFEPVQGLRYKVDSNHDIVYIEMDDPVLSTQEILNIFKSMDLEARFVGSIPPEIQPKSKTQRLRV